VNFHSFQQGASAHLIFLLEALIRVGALQEVR